MNCPRFFWPSLMTSFCYRSRSPSKLYYSSIRLSSNTSMAVCVRLTPSKYWSGVGNDSSFGALSFTLGSTWWRWMQTPRSTKDRFGLHCHKYTCPIVETVQLSLKMMVMLFASCRVLLDWGGFLDNLISSRQCDCSICDGEHENYTVFGMTTSFAMSLRVRTSDASKLSSSSMSAPTMSPFHIPPA